MKQPDYDPLNIGNEPGQGPLRAGGRGMPVSMDSDDNLPSKPAHAVKAQAPALKLVRDLWAGNQKLQEEAETYLPRGAGEDWPNYRVRLKRATLFNVFANTVRGLIGFIFREPPKLEGDGEDGAVDPTLEEHWENIDGAGTHGAVFAREIATEAMIDGHAAILVDFPKTGGTQTLRDEKVGAIRPYWVPIYKGNIVSWRTAVVGGSTVLTQLVLKEVTFEPRGMFGEVEVTRYRVLWRNEAGVVGFWLLRVSDNKEIIVEDEGTYPTQVEIPVAEVTTAGKKGLFDSDPPLLDLAYLNLAHYRQWSDYDTSIYKTCVPILFTAGVLLDDGTGGKTELVVGPNSAISANDPSAKAEYVSHGGEALAACKASLDDLENRMGALGLAAMATSKRVAETATAKEIDKGASDSALAVTARGIQDALERAVEFHARYLGVAPCEVELNDNYVDMVMDAATMTAWGSLATALQLPPRVVIEALIAGGRLPETTDVDALELEMQAAQEAERQRAADELQMQLDAKAKQPAVKAA